MKILQFVLWSIFILIAVISGIVTHSILNGLMVYFGMLCLNLGYGLDVAKRKRFFIAATIGLVLIGIVALRSKLEGRWIWTPIWILAAFPLFLAGVAMRKKAPKLGIMATYIGSGICFIFAVVSPYINYGLIDSPSFFLWLLVWLLFLLGFFLADALVSKGIKSKTALGIFFSLLLMVSVILGMATESIYISVVTFVGLFLVYKDLSKILDKVISKYRHFYLSSIVGLIFIGVATWLDKLQAGWIWTPIWIFPSFPLLLVGSTILSDSKEKSGLYDQRMAQISRMALVGSALCILFALAGPSVLSGLPFMQALFTWILFAFGFISIILAWSEGGAGRAQLFISLALLGTILLGASTFYSQFAGRWIWTFFWFGGAILTLFGARGVIKYAKSKGIFGYILSFIYAVFAVTGPLFDSKFVGVFRPLLSMGKGNITTIKLVIVATIALIAAFLAGYASQEAMKLRRAKKKILIEPKKEGILSDVALRNIMEYVVKKEEEEKKSGS